MTRRCPRGLAAGLLAAAGTLLLLQGGWIEAKAWLAQGLLARAWQATQEHDRPTRPWPWADTWPVARLRVPGLGVERLVLHGASGRTLAFGPAWDSASARPGAPGLVLLSGHRDTHFRFLADLGPGTRLELEGVGGRRAYAVEATRVFDSRHEHMADPGGEDLLVLVTCYPFDTLRPRGPLRYAVIARALTEIEKKS